MKKKIISCLMLAVIFTVSYCYSYIDKNSYLYDRSTDAGGFAVTGVLEEEKEIRQKFIADEETIDGISIKMNILGNVDNVVVNCRLLDASMQELCTVDVYANTLDDNKFNQINFPSVKNAKGKQFTIVLKEKNADGQNGINFYYELRNQVEEELIIRDNQVDGVLVARSISRRFDVETFCVLLGIIGFVAIFMRVLYRYFK